MALIENETTTETMTPDPPVQAPVKKPAGLTGRCFGALFRTGRAPRRIDFVTEIEGETKECYVSLQMLDKDHRNEIARLSGGKVTADAGASILDFLVGHTLVDFTLWERPFDTKGARISWQQVRPAPGEGAIARQVVKQFRAMPEFWDALVEECLAENGFTDADEGNSIQPSES